MEQTVEHIMELSNELIKLGDRITMLEKDASYVTSVLIKYEEIFTKTVKDIDIDLNDVRETIKVVEKSIKNARITFDTVVSELKESVSKNSLERLSQRVDAWNPESFITNYELKRTLQD